MATGAVSALEFSTSTGHNPVLFGERGMPAKRIPMHKIEQILRLRHDSNLSFEQIARACGLSKGVVAKYLKLAEQHQIGWPLPTGMDAAELQRRLLAQTKAPVWFIEPDYPTIHTELKRKGVTLQLLWQEYVEIHGDRGYRYTQFCEKYRQWRARQKRSMRQRHYAGEKMFIDYCGPTVGIIDQATGEVRRAQIFVAVLGASSYTYAEATWSQGLPDWIASHQRAFRFFGGVPELLIPDNLKAGVTRADRYDPLVNATYQEMAQHYRTAILPARPRKPKDKPKAEIGVQVVERWILARLRHHTFFSLHELNVEIRALLTELNERPFQKLPGSRRSQYEALDAPALRPLPESPYVFAEWKRVRPGIDYHVEFDGHFYSVPHGYSGHSLDLRATATTVECFHGNERVAAHGRARGGGFTTRPDHMPAAHRHHLEWTPSRFLRWAADIGDSTHAIVEWQLTHRPHPEHGYRRCLGLLRHAKRYGVARLEAACKRALHANAPSYRSVTSILSQGLDREPLPDDDAAQSELPPHENVRGADYYREEDASC